MTSQSNFFLKNQEKSGTNADSAIFLWWLFAGILTISLAGACCFPVRKLQ
jgi:hypothetical protein